MKLQELLVPLKFQYNQDQVLANPTVTSLEMDSRNVKNGTVFFCIKGYTVDGHDFAKQAEGQGAVAIIAERPLSVSVPVIVVPDTKRAMAKLACHFYDYPTEKLQLIGVTGTNGKTTVTHLIEKIMQDANRKTGLIGTMYTKVGKTQYETKNTTPESLPLQKLFKEMVDEKVDVSLMEVSSHALHLGRVRGCDFDVAVFTNLSPDHLDYHKTMESYLYAKGLLFAQLGNTYSNKVAVLNADDAASEEMARLTTVDVVTYGVRGEADITAKNIEMTPSGTTFDVVVFGQTERISLQLIGMFSVYNALAAIAAAYVSGVSLTSIKQSLEQVEGVSGRFETVDEGQDFTVIVDYAHTADSLENVLTTVKEFAQARIFAIVGCGGDRDRTKRPIMAQIATKYADQAIFTSDNPRSENPEIILEDMIAGVSSGEYEVIIDRETAIKQAINEAKKGDIIIIAGKGHETYQILKDKTIHFDDREVARDAIRSRFVN
ncbi:UDP-N-acetylmuramoylalanyl-D-glutamate-2,6-diaminopimelate ligase [Halalkalibacter wakoensis JCM 9140]|uniref:UDP-N-acetylmuramoyl-L-alanyl-D-glutamate--2,6-diaminopimelate ligase n=1 Tax=Halalkalibacter wakoensis JCM 9140 TaxID=1236970 RepID=W4PWB3_9BACI|nr:UDP-N-acetylmuramoyl-L-alanyl-D-glutamate--2,6-diaminopimelate ligase [Halalkalibacter wakoensis]GAE24146.1 UDP-N-acetylmuramoylalanyl-D-glutamate-2,6-diaminopimelate ligase [Halalkalibacter wakoensis JCM 9140]